MSKEPKRNVYVGHRYVPKIMGEWEKTETYEGLSIVTYQGTSYTSKKRVPKGIDILNEEYWAVTGNYNAQVDQYRQELRDVETEVRLKLTQNQEAMGNVLSQLDNKVSSKVYNKSTPSFSLIDDDGNYYVYGRLKKMMESRGFTFSFAVPSKRIEKEIDGYITNQMAKELIESGHEILSHSHSHTDLTTLTGEAIDYELRESRRIIEHAFNVEVPHIIYPYGGVNKEVVEKAKKYYDSGITTEYYPNSPYSTYNVGRIPVGQWGDDNWDRIKQRIDYNIEHGNPSVLMTHIGENSEAQIKLLEKTLDYIKSRGYTITTYGEQYEVYKNLIDYGEFNESLNQMAFSIGYNGKVGGYSIDLPVEHIQTGILNATSKLFEFPNKISTTLIRTNNSQGLPNEIGGLLVTHKSGGQAWGTFQEFYEETSHNKFLRHYDTAKDNWGVWEKILTESDIENIQHIKQLEQNSVNGATPYSEFPNNKISYCFINDYNSDGLPDGLGGLLMTNRMSSNEYGFYQELLNQVNQTKHIRFFNPPTLEWKEWKLIS